MLTFGRLLLGKAFIGFAVRLGLLGRCTGHRTVSVTPLALLSCRARTRRAVVTCGIRFLPLVLLLPALAWGSLGPDIILVEPENAETRGFYVQIKREHPYFRVTIRYPVSIHNDWVASYAIVGYWDPAGEIRFFARSNFGDRLQQPVELTLVDTPESSDASADIHYVCVSKNAEICEEGTETVYHIKSIRAFL